MATETTALAVLESYTALQIFEPGFIDPVIGQIEAEARAEASRLDISTEANRKALASLAYKVARSKTFIDTQRKALVADEKKRLKRIDEEGARIWSRLERLQEDVRKPLTEWEEADKARIAAHERALAEIENAGTYTRLNWQALPAEAIADRIREVEQDSRNWEEFGSRAAGIKAVTLDQMNRCLKDAQKKDAEAAELSRLRAEAAEREKKDREERIAREAQEKAEREAKEREERAAREAQQKQQKIEVEKKAAEQKAADAERRRVADQREASRKAKEAAEQAERDKQAAIEAERKRVAAEEKRKRDEQEKREANARIRKRVLGEISTALINLDLDITVGASLELATALADSKIPHVTVVF